MKQIELKFPYAGTGVIDEDYINIRILGSVYLKGVSIEYNTLMSYERYCYDVSVGKRHTQAEFDDMLNNKKIINEINYFSANNDSELIIKSETKGIAMPEIVTEYHKSFLFGLFKASIIIEDRKAADPTRNFKHMINFSFLKFKYAIVLRSSSEGSYFINDKEVFND